MPARHSQRWKDLERTVAATLGGRRIVRQDLFESAPDVIVTDSGLIAECKAYRKFRHHSLLETAQKKYGRNGQTVILVTKAERQVGAYATVPLDYLADLLNQVRQHHQTPPTRQTGEQTMDNKKTDDAHRHSTPKIKREWPVSMEVRAALAAEGRAIRAAGHTARMRRINTAAKKKGKA